MCAFVCVAACCLSLFHMESEQIRQGDNEMGGETEATFTSDLGNNFSPQWMDNGAGATAERQSSNIESMAF